MAAPSILTVIGARPQFIKAAVVSHAFLKHGINETILHTGQHFDANMSAVFFDELGIPKPKHHLNIGGGSHGQNTGRMLEEIESVLLKDRPEWVLVYGDTDSTLAGALAAVKLHIPVAHVEAGLRSFNRQMPEEINRILTDHAAELLFTPTTRATEQLTQIESVPAAKVIQVGDVMYDAALHFGALAEGRSKALANLGLSSKTYILATVHRAENTDEVTKLAQILQGFAKASMPVVWPIHPRTRKRLAEFDLELPDSVKLIDPVGYIDMVMLQRHAAFIATDSGGVQKEAYFQNVPCITLREQTEWTELIDLGVNHLVGTDSDQIALHLATPSPTQPSSNTRHKPSKYSPYGSGDASHQIASELIKRS